MPENKNNDVVLSVKDLHVSFYTNQRCNKVLKGVSFDIRRGRHSVLLENRDAENRSQRTPFFVSFRIYLELNPAPSRTIKKTERKSGLTNLRKTAGKCAH